LKYGYVHIAEKPAHVHNVIEKEQKRAK